MDCSAALDMLLVKVMTVFRLRTRAAVEHPKSPFTVSIARTQGVRVLCLFRLSRMCRAHMQPVTGSGLRKLPYAGHHRGLDYGNYLRGSACAAVPCSNSLSPTSGRAY